MPALNGTYNSTSTNWIKKLNTYEFLQFQNKFHDFSKFSNH